jgi:hypothetical protein
MLESDDEDAQPTSKAQQNFVDNPEFEDSERFSDDAEDSLPIVQHLDLILNTEVLNISFPRISSRSINSIASGSVPPIASQKIVMAVTCGDNTVRVITLPLTPPSHESKDRDMFKKDIFLAQAGNGAWGERVLIIGGSSGHQVIPSGVSITFTPHTALGVMVFDDDDDDDDPQESSKEQGWDILLASHSTEDGGLLLVFRIPIVKLGKDDYTTSADPVSPFQRQHLSSPAVSISFNPSSYPSRRHSHLLVAGSQGAIRVYECLSPTPVLEGDKSRSRRSSIALAYNQPLIERGSWLISLYPGFASSNDSFSSSRSVSQPQGAPQRKIIVNAQWVLNGKSIMVLLADGEWGVWDLEGAGPGRKKDSILGDASAYGVQGGAISKWALSGWLGDTPKAPIGLLSGIQQFNKGGNSGKFAPMTPGTRRIREDSLFGSNSISSSLGSYVAGGISVWNTSGVFSEHDDDIVAIWYADELVVITSLWGYWTSQLSKKSRTSDPFSRSAKADGRLVKLGFTLRGDKPTAVEIVPPPRKPGYSPRASQDGSDNADGFGLVGEVVVSGEHRLSIVSEKTKTPYGRRLNEKVGTKDQQLAFNDGEQDLAGIDSALAGMEKRNVFGQSLGTGKRKVNFLFN